MKTFLTIAAAGNHPQPSSTTAPRSATATATLRLTVQADCRLEGASQPLLNALYQELTIDNPKYQAAHKYGRWVGKNLPRRLYFYELHDDVLRFPRGFAKQAVRLCRQFMGRGPQVIDQRRLLPAAAFDFQGELRPYQQLALNELLQSSFGVLEAGTGSGKTVMALAAIAARQQPTLILLHSKELMYQWQERIKTFLGLTAGLIGDGLCQLGPISVAIVNTARKHLDDLPRHFGQLIVDECHRVPASLFTDVVTAFDAQYTLGLSATAYRREDGLTKLIYYYLGERTARVEAKALEAAGMVLKPCFIQRPTAFNYGFRGDYAALMTALTQDDARNRQIAADIAAESGQGAGTVLVVSDRVAHCETLAERLLGQGIAVTVLTGRVPARNRQEIVEAVRRGSIKVLISTLQLIGEGFDCPGLTTLFLTTPIKFSGRLLQVVGRILRPAAGKEAKVYDYIDPVGVLQASARTRLLTYQQED